MEIPVGTQMWYWLTVCGIFEEEPVNMKLWFRAGTQSAREREGEAKAEIDR